jgi:hypothetical protein
VYVATAASGSSTGSYVGIYSSTGTLLSGSADIATSVSAVGAAQIVLTTPQSVGVGYVYAALLINGLTAPEFQNGAGMPDIGPTPLRFAVNGQNGIASLPPSITVASNTGTNAIAWWVGAS